MESKIYSPIHHRHLNPAELRQSLTDSTIKALTAQFSAIIAERGDIAYKGRDPREDYAFTSSSAIAGVYFPNAEIIFANISKNYDFCALGVLANGEAVAIFSLNEQGEEWRAKAGIDMKQYFSDYAYIPLDDLQYSREEQAIAKRLAKYATDARGDLALLRSITRQYKKDGKPFARLEANFGGASKVSVDYTWSGFVSSVDIAGTHEAQYHEVRLYFNNSEKTEITADEVSEKINERVAVLAEQIKNYEKQLKALHRQFLKAQKIARRAIEFLEGEEALKDGNRLNSLGYALKDYIEKAVDCGRID